MMTLETARTERARYVTFLAEFRGMSDEMRTLQVMGVEGKVFGNECFRTLRSAQEHHLALLKKNWVPRYPGDTPTAPTERARSALIDLMSAQLDFLARIGKEN